MILWKAIFLILKKAVSIIKVWLKGLGGGKAWFHANL